jgi:hypothetical protein
MYSLLPELIKKAFDSLITTTQSFGVSKEEATNIFLPEFFRQYLLIIQEVELKNKKDKPDVYTS